MRVLPLNWTTPLMRPTCVWCGEIQESEVKEALKRMKGGKAMGPECIPIEVWKGLGDIAIVWLTKLFNLIFRANKMPEEWRRSILVPIFKNKGMFRVVLITVELS